MNRHWYYRGELLGEGKSAVTYRFYLGEPHSVAQNTQESDEYVSSNQRTPLGSEVKPTLEAVVTRIMSRVEAGLPDSVSVKLYKDDPGNYIPFEQALTTELGSYQELCRLGLRIPQLYGHDEEQYLLVKEFIQGPSGMELVARDGVTEAVWRQIIALARRLIARGKNIDYFPANFLVQDGELVYVDYEIHPFDPEWGFEQWGIFYWLNPSGVREFLRTGDGNAINKPGTYKPYDGPALCARRDELLSRWI